MQAVANIESALAAPAPSGEQLVDWLGALAVQRDRGAFASLYEHFAPRVKSYMMRLGTESAAAEDLAQETMVQVWRKAALYDPAKASPSAWVFTVARNLRVDRLRRQRLHTVDLQYALDKPDESQGGEERAISRLDAARLPGLVQELPEDQLKVVHLAFFEGLSHAQIGETIGVPLGTVKSRLRLAFGKLRRAMGEQP